MRFLFVNNHCISDPTAGVTQSLRTIMEWLADAGHACHILTTARFESSVTFTIADHLAQQGVEVSRLASPHGPAKRSGKRSRVADRPVVHYTVRGVPVTLLLTRHNDESPPDQIERLAPPSRRRAPHRGADCGLLTRLPFRSRPTGSDT